MSAIGGYFELECGNTPLYYTDGVYLNNCRNGLRYLIRALGIRKIYLPYYSCHVVAEAILKEGCELVKYWLDRDLMPVGDFRNEDFIIYNNYFGVTGNKVAEMSRLFPNLIVDNAQAFYNESHGRASVYSPRKFFGLPDGGILRGQDIPSLNLERGNSFGVMSHLLKRFDLGAEAGYKDFAVNDAELDNYPIEEISGLTRALMGNIDYVNVKNRRIENFNYLKNNLPTLFPISMDSTDVPLVYPLLMEDGSELRDKLIENKVFCARYWPNVLDDTDEKTWESFMTRNIVAIPIDQRYGISEMKRIVNIINS